MSNTEIFEDVVILPDTRGQQAYDQLVGLDEYKERLVKEVLLLLDPGQLQDWNKKHHKGKLAAIDLFASRPPLFILAGDVGTGKSALAKSFGNEVAKRSKVRIELHALSLNSRGSGAVGEMTRLISGAFRLVAALSCSLTRLMHWRSLVRCPKCTTRTAQVSTP
jgi:SpoVK/Ycf46/Vps4 family AAA+-type ATPase